jgi:hypothetical protein
VRARGGRSRGALLALASLSAVVLVGVAGPAPRAAYAADEGQVGYRQILVTWAGAERSAATRTKEAAKARAQTLLVHAGSPGVDFAVLARTESDDKDTAAKGGFVGLFGPGRLDPTFERSLRAIPEGVIGGPLESPLGFHVVLRLPPAEARAVLEQNSLVLYGALFPLRDLTFGPEYSRTKEQALADATKAVDLLRSGTPIPALPPALHAKPLRKNGWPTVLFRGSTLPAFHAVEEEGARLAVDEVGKPIDTPAGWLVVRRAPFFHARVQHLLVMHLDSLGAPDTIRRPSAEARVRATEALEAFRKDPSAWSAVVAKYSDDPATASRGGDLGWIEPGDRTPEFDAIVARLKPGQTSGVVETRLGFHVVRRLD